MSAGKELETGQYLEAGIFVTRARVPLDHSYCLYRRRLLGEITCVAARTVAAAGNGSRYITEQFRGAQRDCRPCARRTHCVRTPATTPVRNVGWLLLLVSTTVVTSEPANAQDRGSTVPLIDGGWVHLRKVQGVWSVIGSHALWQS